MHYFRLIQHAYKLTVHNPILWVFGLFVIGGSNLNFFHFRELFPVLEPSDLNLLNILVFLQERPALLATVSLGLLAVSTSGLIITNWSRIMLILTVTSLLENKRVELRRHVRQSRYLLIPVVKVSLLTTSFMIAIAAALAIPPLLFTSGYYRTILIVLGVFVFLPLAFTVSCINIFTTFFIVVFRKKFSSALNLGTDIFLSRWTQILGLVFLLIAIYSAGFLAGAVITYLLNLTLGTLAGFLANLGEPAISAIMVGIQFLSGLVLWLWLAGLNVFLNTVLLLLFYEMITPIKAEQEKVKELVAQPAVSS